MRKLWVYTHNCNEFLSILCYNHSYLESEVINMPNRNGTGPEGKGPKTGRGLGPCGDGQPRGGGRGRGLGAGLGLGRNAGKPQNSQSQDN